MSDETTKPEPMTKISFKRILVAAFHWRLRRYLFYLRCERVGHLAPSVTTGRTHDGRAIGRCSRCSFPIVEAPREEKAKPEPVRTPAPPDRQDDPRVQRPDDNRATEKPARGNRPL